jgi:hypothetical protein
MQRASVVGWPVGAPRQTAAGSCKTKRSRTITNFVQQKILNCFDIYVCKNIYKTIAN